MTASAPITRRLAAFAIDAALCGLPAWTCGSFGAYLLVSEAGARQYAGLLMVGGSLLLSALFYWALQLTQALRGRQTPGQRRAGVRLISAEGEPLSRRQAVKRELVARAGSWAVVWWLGLFPLLAVDAAWCLIDRDRRSVRDRICKTTLTPAS
jgi:uncharacterized RDD family membrane protein YckC